MISLIIMLSGSVVSSIGYISHIHLYSRINFCLCKYQVYMAKIVDPLISKTLQNITGFLGSEDFKREWKHWGLHTPISHAKLYAIVCEIFMHPTPTTRQFEYALFSCLISVLNIIKLMYIVDDTPTTLQTSHIVTIVTSLMFNETHTHREYHSLYQSMCVEYARLHMAARRIQHAWKRAITDPTYCLCKTRLLRDFQDFRNMFQG